MLIFIAKMFNREVINAIFHLNSKIRRLKIPTLAFITFASADSDIYINSANPGVDRKRCIGLDIVLAYAIDERQAVHYCALKPINPMKACEKK